MATTIDNYKIKIDVEGTEKIKAASDKIGGLATAILGVGVIAFINEVLKLADSISDLAKATGMSIGSIARFQAAMQQAGGSADNASKMIAAFFNKVDDAAKGIDTAQRALGNLGITFQDLQNLSEQALFDKAIHSLAQMEAGAKRTALGMDVFGKSFKDIDPKELDRILATGSFDELQKAIEHSAELNDKLERSFFNLKLAAMEAIDKILSLFEPIVGKVSDTTNELEKARKVIQAVEIALAAAFGLKAIAMVVDMTQAILKLAAAMKAAEVSSMGFGSKLGLLGKIGVGIGLLTYAGGLNAGEDEELDRLRKIREEKEKAANETKKAIVPQRQVQLYTEEELRSRHQALVTAQQQTLELRNQDLQARKYLQTVISTIGMDTDKAARITTNAQLEQEANNKVLMLKKQIAEEEAKGYMVMGQRKGVNEGVVSEYKKQITEVQSNLSEVKKLKDEEFTRTENLARQRLEIARQADEMSRMADLVSVDRQASNNAMVISGAATEEQVRRLNELDSLETEYNRKRLSMQKDYSLATTQSARDDIKKRMSDEETYYNWSRQQLEEKYRQEDELRKSSAAGARAAFEQIARSMDPYQVAQQKTNALWDNMTRAIDNFVDNGKLSFEDFATSVIKDLIKIELKASAMNLWQIMKGAAGGGGGGGGGGFLGDLISTGLGFLGFATGGSPPLDRPSIVGEKGPELFIPRTAGTIVPNNAMGGTPVQNTYVTNNISAIDGASVARLFTQNRHLLLGTVEQAKKELPMNLVRGR
jgi:lambda family phage tail tape measure protein